MIGIDFAAAMLRIGRQKVARASIDGTVALLRGDASRIPLADESVDAVTIGFGIRNVEETGGGVPRNASRPRARRPHRDPGIRDAVYTDRESGVPDVLHHVLPRIGRLVSRHGAAYGYLPASVSAFASPDEFVAILRHSGFTRVSASPLTFGIVFLYTGTETSG